MLIIKPKYRKQKYGGNIQLIKAIAKNPITQTLAATALAGAAKNLTTVLAKNLKRKYSDINQRSNLINREKRGQGIIYE